MHKELFRKAERLRKLPPYLFKEIDRKKQEIRARGVDIIDLGVGDPDLPTPPHVIQALKDAVDNPACHRYPSYSGMKEFRDAVAGWYEARFGVVLSPDREVVALIGSKEGIAHLPLAFVNPGDVVLAPSPAYPVYHTATIFAGGASHFMPLDQENDFLPDLDAIPEDTAARAKIMFMNYPNNPTAAVADRAFFDRAVAFSRRHGILLCHDAAYSEMAFDGYRAPSLFQSQGAMDVGLEFHSLSKTYNMTGWRIGFAVGNEAAVQGLAAIKSNIDSGAFEAVQRAAIAAINGDQSCVSEMIGVYRERRDVMVRGLRGAGFRLDCPKATFYLWVRTPEDYSSADLTARLLEEAGVVVTPGNGFGESGEGFFRIALTQKKVRLEEALERIARVNF